MAMGTIRLRQSWPRKLSAPPPIPIAFPEQIKEGLQPWQAKKLYIGNVCGFGAITCPDAPNYTVKLNTGKVRSRCLGVPT